MTSPDHTPPEEDPFPDPWESNELEEDSEIGLPLQLERWLADKLMRLDKDSPFILAEMADKASENGDLQWAERCIRECIEIAEHQKQSETWLCMFYVQLGVVLRTQKRYEEAEKWLLKAHELADGIPLRAGRSWDVACEMQQLLNEQGRHTEADAWESKGKILSKNIRDKWDRKKRGLPE